MTYKNGAFKYRMCYTILIKSYIVLTFQILTQGRFLLNASPVVRQAEAAVFHPHSFWVWVAPDQLVVCWVLGSFWAVRGVLLVAVGGLDWFWAEVFEACGCWDFLLPPGALHWQVQVCSRFHCCGESVAGRFENDCHSDFGLVYSHCGCPSG